MNPGFSTKRRTRELQRGRTSQAGAVYFVTFCTRQRTPMFHSSTAHAAGRRVTRSMVEEGDVAMFAITSMPDHVHLLFRLGERLALDRVVAKWRAQVGRLVAGLDWQPNYFEHRLRPAEEIESYAWYVFMNPYRAGLIEPNECWPGWWSDGSMDWKFLREARQGPCPQPEWLDVVEDWEMRLVTGE